MKIPYFMQFICNDKYFSMNHVADCFSKRLFDFGEIVRDSQWLDHQIMESDQWIKVSMENDKFIRDQIELQRKMW